MTGRSRGRGRWIAAAAAGLWLAAPAWGQDQYIQFEPPAYGGSPEGVPLEGQDGWYLPGTGGGGDWLIFSGSDPAFPIGPSTASLQQYLGVVTLGDAPASVERNMKFGLDLGFEIELAAAFVGLLPAPDMIGRVSLEPEELRSTFAVLMTWDDPHSPDYWTLEIVRYTSAGEPVTQRLAGGLKSSEWYEISVRVQFDTNRILGVRVASKVTGTLAAFSPTDWYLAGGAGAPGPPSAIRLTAGDGMDAGTVVATDNIFIGGFRRCYVDCDRNGYWDLFDFLCFQNLFAAGDRYADCDGSGSLDLFDFLCFQMAFASGCGP